MPVRYVLTTLKNGVKPEDYERWLREYDYRVAKTLPSIISYRTHRVEGPINGAEQAGWHSAELWTDPAQLFSLHLLEPRQGP